MGFGLLGIAVTWWKMHGGQCPELQRLAIRVLSQPCCGTSRFNLDRHLSEELHSSLGITCLQKQLLLDREFVRNNRILCCLDMNTASIICHENFNVLSDWVLQ
jgi:hAT family C-terminal dimerisation region